MAGIVLIRHGETPWSREGRHTGRTDITLTTAGRAAAAALAPALAEHPFGYVACSPLSRARDTAALAGLSPDVYTDDLLEWDYGGFEGRTTSQIRSQCGHPSWVIWQARVPPGDSPGEQLQDVARRCRRVLAACAPYLTADEDVALVAHGHVLRILTATWLGLEPTAGRLFALATGTLSRLGFERDQPVIDVWNSQNLPT